MGEFLNLRDLLDGVFGDSELLGVLQVKALFILV